MSHRTLTILNLFGVGLLAVLCGYQWRVESRLTHEIDGLLRNKHANEEQIAAQAKSIEDLTGDLNLFKGQLAATKEELAETTRVLRNAERENARLTQNCEQLKANIEVWKAAVKERDEHIAEANAHLKELVERVNEGVLKYNDLAKKHNEVVALLNGTREQLAQAYKDLDDTRRKLYKALGQEIPKPEQKPAEKATAPTKPPEVTGAVRP